MPRGRGTSRGSKRIRPVHSTEHVTDSHPPIRADSTNDRRTDLRTIDPHYGYREVYRVLDCDLSIEPDPDPVSFDPVDAPFQQALKKLRGTGL